MTDVSYAELLCRWRGAEVRPGLRACLSPAFLGGWQGVPAATCARCTLRDHAPPKPKKRSLPCIHLGAETGATLRCDSCRGQVQVKLRACAVHGHCTESKAVANTVCCPSCPDRQEPAPPPTAPARASDPSCGVVVGCYQWPRLAELQVRVIRATCGPVPILLSDDRSPPDRWQQYDDLSDRYPDVTVRHNEVRIGHAGGDLSALFHGLLWAAARGLAGLAKLSQRCLLLPPYWLQDGVQAMLGAGLPTAGKPGEENGNRFPLRSEAVLFDPGRWVQRPDVLADLGPRQLRTATELVVALAAEKLDGTHPWALLGEDRMVRDEGVLWHCSATDEDYHQLAARHGLGLDWDFSAGDTRRYSWYDWG